MSRGSLEENSILSVEEVEKELSKIERKYSPVKSSMGKDSFEETLAVLSKEFDSIGLPAVDLTQGITKIFKNVVNNARSLVQIHRKTISQIKDVHLENQYKTTKSAELYKLIDDCKLQNKRCEEKNALLQNRIVMLTNERADLLKKEVVLKNEMDQVKRYHSSKQNELERHLSKLARENQLLRQMFGKEIHRTNNDITLELLSKYKHDEEIYKATIQKMQDNNTELLEDIINLKLDMVMDKNKCS